MTETIFILLICCMLLAGSITVMISWLYFTGRSKKNYSKEVNRLLEPDEDLKKFFKSDYVPSSINTDDRRLRRTLVRSVTQMSNEKQNYLIWNTLKRP